MKPEAIPFARKVLEFAETEHPDFQFDMRSFWGTISCGTSACLAGTAVFLDPEVEIKHGVPFLAGQPILTSMSAVGVERRGAQLMGLDPTEANRLFYTMSNFCALKILRELIEEAEEKERNSNE